LRRARSRTPPRRPSARLIALAGRPEGPPVRRWSVGLPVWLRGRSLGRKRSLAVREFGLGIEALERFVRGEPLYRVHECAFGVLAMESEPVDPRL